MLSRHPGTIVVPDAVAAHALDVALDEAAALAAFAWRPPAVRAWPSVLREQFATAQWRGEPQVAAIDFVLSPDQELALWQQVIAASDDGDARAAAGLARTAWSLMHTWDLPAPTAVDATDDILAFMHWGGAFRQRTAESRVIDQVRLLAQTQTPFAASVLAHGFVAPPPRLVQLLTNATPMTVAARAPFAARAYADREQELYAACTWAAAQAACSTRIVIAHTNLRQDQELLRRCVRDVWGSDDAVNFATQLALASDPRIRCALALCEFHTALAWEHVSAILLSPTVRGAESERGARARCDAALRALGRSTLPVTIVFEYLAAPAHPCPSLAAVLTAVRERNAAVPRRQPLVRWLAHFSAILNLAGWPGAGAVDAATLRLQREWGEIGDRLQQLDAVLPAQTLAAALARLRRMLADTPARPAPSTSGVFIVTPAVACVLAPTHLWLAGCESAAFTAGARPSPFLPLAAQRAAGVPGADAGRDLARARLLLAALGAGTTAAVASYRAGDGEQVFSPSPLLAGLRDAPVAAVSVTVPSSWRQSRADWEEFADTHVPALSALQFPRGGVGLLAAQAACPFRAQARYRLAATAVDEPRPGLSAIDRGNGVHRALAAIWTALGSHSALLALSSAARAELVQRAAEQAIVLPARATSLERALGVLERQRLESLLDQWLTFEGQRSSFTVLAIEQAAEVKLGPLALRIRVDRIDARADGSSVIIDYKTGRSNVAEWQPPRIDAPQLPVYACADLVPAVRAIVFAEVDRVRSRWLSSGDDCTPDAWHSQRAAWAADLAALASEFVDGLALVAPKRGGQTCRLCDQALLCRVASTALADPDVDDSEPSDDV